MLAAVVAQTASGEAPPFDIFSLLLPLALAFLLFTMFRRQRKSQQQVKEMRTQMEPGTEVMTQFGLYGTIVSIDQENNKAVLELSPGTFATVHTQALSKVVLQDTAAADSADDVDHTATADDATAHELGSSSVPDDASSIDDVDRSTPTGSTGSTGTTAGGSTAAASTATPDQDREGRDPLGPNDPPVKRDN